jgi:hypothetical protein
MSTRSAPEHHHPLIDPLAFEEAGRHLREWLDRLLHRAEPEPDTSIAWESGEPDDEASPPGR